MDKNKLLDKCRNFVAHCSPCDDCPAQDLDVICSPTCASFADWTTLFGELKEENRQRRPTEGGLSE